MVGNGRSNDNEIYLFVSDVVKHDKGLMCFLQILRRSAHVWQELWLSGD